MTLSGSLLPGKSQAFGLNSANYITDSGFFLCWDNVTDIPDSSGGFLESVVPDKKDYPNFRKQTFLGYNSGLYVRHMWGGSGQPWGGNWTAWKFIG